MKRVMIITYYWPPSAGPGVQRWLKFAKYLRDFGWEPVIFTPENPQAPARDEALLSDIPDGLVVLKTPIREPYKWYSRLTGNKEGASVGFTSTQKGKLSGLSEKAARWIRGNFFIPDARKAWVEPSVRYLSDYLKKNKTDVIITTGPPHSLHLIGLELKKKLGIKWAADFRDPWTGIDFYDDLMLTSFADEKHRRLEKNVLQNADVVITVGEAIKKELKSLGAGRVEVIRNGFDLSDFDEIKTKPSPGFTLVHAGSLIPSRNPSKLWVALAGLCREKPDFGADLTVRLIGKTDYSVRESIDESGLKKQVVYVDYIPHKQVIQELFEAQVLLLLINKTRNAKGFLTGKLFEYLAASRPVLCIGPASGEAAQLIRETGAGFTAAFDDETGMKKQIEQWYDTWKSNGVINQKTAKTLIYSRKALTGDLSNLLNSLTE